VWLDANAFLQREWGREFGMHDLLQAASQEPTASFLSRGASSTAQILGLPLIQWVGKPEGRYPGVCTLMDRGREVRSVAFSPDGTWVVSGSDEGVVKIWNVLTGALVSSFVEVS
jgi:WD40 repeat protein